MMIDERALIPISAVNALKRVRRACVVMNGDHSPFEDVFSNGGVGNCSPFEMMTCGARP